LIKFLPIRKLTFVEGAGSQKRILALEKKRCKRSEMLIEEEIGQENFQRIEVGEISTLGFLLSIERRTGATHPAKACRQASSTKKFRASNIMRTNGAAAPHPGCRIP